MYLWERKLCGRQTKSRMLIIDNAPAARGRGARVPEEGELTGAVAAAAEN